MLEREIVVAHQERGASRTAMLRDVGKRLLDVLTLLGGSYLASKQGNSDLGQEIFNAARDMVDPIVEAPTEPDPPAPKSNGASNGAH